MFELKEAIKYSFFLVLISHVFFSENDVFATRDTAKPISQL